MKIFITVTRLHNQFWAWAGYDVPCRDISGIIVFEVCEEGGDLLAVFNAAKEKARSEARQRFIDYIPLLDDPPRH